MVVNVSCETERYIKILQAWNQKINLIGNEVDLPRHIEDSVELLRYLKENDTIVDVGSGNGLPGVVLAACGANVTLVERDQRKAAFLRSALSQMGLKSRVLQTDCRNVDEKFDTIVCKAFASLSDIIELTRNMGNKLLLIKGKSIATEIESALKKYVFSVEIHPIPGENKGVIVEVWNIRNA